MIGSASRLIAPWIVLLIAGALIPLLAACASDGPPEPGRREDPAAVARRLPNVFISPAGKPFRAPPGQPYPVAAWFAEADADHEGRPTREELRADTLAFFHRLDTNHDGVIDGFEVADYEQATPEILPHIGRLHAGEGLDQSLDFGDDRNTSRPRGERRPSGLAPARPSRSDNTEPTQGAALFSLINEPEPVAAADTQFDGRITASAFAAAADRRFDLLETNQKGYLTLAELPKTPVQAAIEKALKARRKAEHDGHGARQASPGG